MASITKDEAERIIQPHFHRFCRIVQSAWEDWMKGEIAPQMQHKRVRANNVWNQMVSHAKRQFDEIKGISIEPLNKCDGILINDNIFIRMKKGNNKLLSRNYPTQASLDFHDQNNDDLFGGIARLELLYILNDSETQVERVVLIQRHKSSIVWSIDLLDEGSENLETTPFAPVSPNGPVSDRIIKPKDGVQKDVPREQSDGSNG